MRDATAAEIVDLALQKPELVIHGGSLPATAEALRDLLAASGKLFDRGLPVRGSGWGWQLAISGAADEA